MILASGLDARPYRLQCLRDIDVYEIDQPEVLAFKASVLTAHGASALARLHLVPIDLRNEKWPNALGAGGFDTSRPTAWLAEGLLPYLSSEDHDRLFTVVTSLSAPGSWLAAEVYPDAEVSFGATRMGKWRDGAKDMSDTIGVSMDVASFIKDDDATDTASWLSRRGWQWNRLTVARKWNRQRFRGSRGHRSGQLPCDCAAPVVMHSPWAAPDGRLARDQSAESGQLQSRGLSA